MGLVALDNVYGRNELVNLHGCTAQVCRSPIASNGKYFEREEIMLITPKGNTLFLHVYYYCLTVQKDGFAYRDIALIRYKWQSVFYELLLPASWHQYIQSKFRDRVRDRVVEFKVVDFPLA